MFFGMAIKRWHMSTGLPCKITVVTPVRAYAMTGRTEAPADSEAYLEV